MREIVGPRMAYLLHALITQPLWIGHVTPVPMRVSHTKDKPCESTPDSTRKNGLGPSAPEGTIGGRIRNCNQA